MGSYRKIIPNLSQKDKDRFYAKINKTDSCWIWKDLKGKDGYGSFYIKRIPYKAHRVSLSLKEKVSQNQDVLHLCNNPSCVNSNHLIQGSHTDNMKHRLISGRHPQANQTHCINGHEFNSKNTSFNKKSNKRSCRLCHKNHKLNYRIRQFVKQIPKEHFEEAKRLVLSYRDNLQVRQTMF